jgi:RNA polymerase sigma-70 factor (ECF subfamily)
MAVQAIATSELDQIGPSREGSTNTLSSGFQRRRRLPEASPAEDRRLRQAISRAKTGDRGAMNYLYCRYADNVYGYLCGITRDEHEAEDITQAVFAKLMTSIGGYHERGVPFSAWLLRVARNAALDHLRKQRSIPVEEVRSPDEAGEESHAGEALNAALGQLSPEQQEIVLLRHVVGLSPSEIAEKMGRTEASVHGLHHRGREKLRVALTATGDAPATTRSANLIA